MQHGVLDTADVQVDAAGIVGSVDLRARTVQYRSFSLSQNTSGLVGSMYRSWYQELPAHCGITLVSRRYVCSPSPRSSSTLTQSTAFASGGEGSEDASSGSNDTGA